MTDLKLERTAALLKALSHPMRLKIALGLADKTECNVSKMAEKLKLAQPAVSQHLAVLKNAGIVTGHRSGTVICYRLTDDKNVRTIIAALGARCGGNL